MKPGSIVEAFDEGEYIARCRGAGLVLAMVDMLCLERVVEALDRRVVHEAKSHVQQGRTARIASRTPGD